MNLAWAFLKRDFRLEKTYRLAFVSHVGGLVATLLSAAFLSRLVPGNSPTLQRFGGDYFTFALIGTATFSYFSVALGSFSTSLGQEQQQGTIEALLVGPNDPRTVLLCGAVWPFTFAAGQLVIYVVLGAALFHAQVAWGNLALATGMLVLTLVAFAAVGLLAGAVIMVAKRTGLFLSLAGSAFGVLGGVLYPIAVLPRPFQVVAAALPMSHGLEGIRLALVPHPDLAAISRDAVALVAFAIVLVPVALRGFVWAVRRCRVTGSLAHY